MTKEKYMALSDFQTLWSDKLKPYIIQSYAAKEHTHDTRYYTETESDAKYATKTELATLSASSIKSSTQFTSSGGTTYTAQQLLEAMAELMNKTVVADPTTT